MSAPRPAPRVDHRTLNAGTGIRFAQLLVLLVASSAAMAASLAESVASGHVADCVLAAGIDPEQPTSNLRPLLGPTSEPFSTCLEQAPLQAEWWFGPAWAVVVVAAAWALFLILPVWRTRRLDRAIPLEALPTGAAIRAELDRIAAEAGLPAAPRTIVDPRATSTKGASVFGSDRRPILRLHAGLLPDMTGNHRRFRAVLLHEFAHVRNRDLTATYATVAVWRVFAVLVLLPYLAVIILPLSDSWTRQFSAVAASFVLRDLLFALGLTALVYLARSEILRTREYCADHAAAGWGADPAGWAADDSKEAEGKAARAWASFTALWRTHPPEDHRRRSLANPATLFEVHALPIALTGAAAIMFGAQIGGLGMASHAALNLIPAGLIASVTGTSLWRSVTRPTADEHSRRTPAGVRVGLWLGIGMAAGTAAATRGAFQGLPTNPEVLLLMLAAGVGFTWWTAQSARLWASRTIGRTVVPGTVLVLAGGWIILAAWFDWWSSHAQIILYGWLPRILDLPSISGFTAQDLTPVDGEFATLLAVYREGWPFLVMTDSPFTWLAAITLWAVPLLAWRVDPQTKTAALLRLRGLLSAALTGGVVGWAVIIAALASMHPWKPELLQTFAAYQTWVVAALAAAALTAATVACALAKRFMLVHALAAAFLAVPVTFAMIVALMAADGCIGPLAASPTACGAFPVELMTPFYVTLVPGTFVLIGIIAFAVAAAAAVARRIRGARRETAPRAPASGPRVGFARRFAVMAACAIAAGFTMTALVVRVTAPVAEYEGLENVAAQDDGSVPEATRSRQVEAWRSIGGDELVDRLADALGDLTAATGEASDPIGASDLDLAAIRAACVELGAVADDADRYFQVPDPESQEIWGELVAQTRDDGAQCEQALDRHNMDLLMVALSGIGEASEILDHLNVILGELEDG